MSSTMLSTFFRAGRASVSRTSVSVRQLHQHAPRFAVAFSRTPTMVAAGTTSRALIGGGGCCSVRAFSKTSTALAESRGHDSNLPSSVLFVNNIPYTKTEEDIKMFFSEWGTVTEVRLAKNDDGRIKGFAHITFSELADATEVKNSSDEEPFVMGGRNLVVNYAVPRAKNTKKLSEKNNRVYFGSFNQDEIALRELFVDFEKDIVDLFFLRDHNTGQRRDSGFITFRTADVAEEAIQTLDRIKLPGAEKALFLSYASPKKEASKSFTKRPRNEGNRHRRERERDSEDFTDI